MISENLLQGWFSGNSFLASALKNLKGVEELFFTFIKGKGERKWNPVAAGALLARQDEISGSNLVSSGEKVI